MSHQCDGKSIFGEGGDDQSCPVAAPTIDRTVYRQVRPTRLDKIKNFRLEIQAGCVGSEHQKEVRFAVWLAR